MVNQTIELGIVDSLTKQVFRCYIKHPRYIVDPYCALMHTETWKALIAKPQDVDVPILAPDELSTHLATWMNGIQYSGKVIAAGKNFNGFDRLFLGQLPIPFKFHYRALDPASMWSRAEDVELLSLSDCVARAGVQTRELHNALDDAWMVHDCIEAFYAKA